MCKTVYPKGKTSISMKNSQVTTKKLCFVEAHGFDCMFQPAHCHVSFLKTLNLIVSYSNVFLIIYSAWIQQLRFALSTCLQLSWGWDLLSYRAQLSFCLRIKYNSRALLFLHPTHLLKNIFTMESMRRSCFNEEYKPAPPPLFSFFIPSNCMCMYV